MLKDSFEVNASSSFVTIVVSQHFSFCIYFAILLGFIGLGIMGEGMAGRLLSEGVAGTADKPLVVWNRTGSKCTALKEKFPDATIEIKDSAKSVIEACGVTYSMLSTPEAAKAVFDAADGVLAGIGEGRSIVDCATLAEADMQRMNEAVVAKGG